MHLTPAHVVVVVLVIVLIFGAAKLPSVAKNLGKSMKVFRDEVKDLTGNDKSGDSKESPAAPDATADAKSDNSQSTN